MVRIDAHQHFWQYNRLKDSWITPEMEIIRRDFMPEDLLPLLTTSGIEGCIAVQAAQSEEETLFLLALAEEHHFIKGVVGWVDLQADNIAERLAHFSSFKMLKGFRNILQSESDRSIMLKPAFKRGIALLGQYNLTYDLLVLPDQLAYVSELAAAFPQQKFVLDHIAKPNIKGNEIGDWVKGIKQLAGQPNVWCKISGMVTEANWHNWDIDTFNPYLDVVFDCFGVDKIMFGSDWPVCLLAADYNQVIEIIKHYSRNLSDTQQEQIFGGNARTFYKCIDL